MRDATKLRSVGCQSASFVLAVVVLVAVTGCATSTRRDGVGASCRPDLKGQQTWLRDYAAGSPALTYFTSGAVGRDLAATGDPEAWTYVAPAGDTSGQTDNYGGTFYPSRVVDGVTYGVRGAGTLVGFFSGRQLPVQEFIFAKGGALAVLADGRTVKLSATASPADFVIGAPAHRYRANDWIPVSVGEYKLASRDGMPADQDYRRNPDGSAFLTYTRLFHNATEGTVKRFETSRYRQEVPSILNKGIVRIAPTKEVSWKRTFVVIPASEGSRNRLHHNAASLEESDGTAKTLPDGTALLVLESSLLRIDLTTGCTGADKQRSAAVDIDAIDRFTLHAADGTAASVRVPKLAADDYFNFVFGRQ